MARRTAREFLNAIFFYEFCAQSELVGWRLVVHPKYILARPDVAFGISVTFQTPLHIERVLAPHERHLVNSAVTGGAADAFMDMNAVVEINEVGQVVHPRPLQRATGAVTLAHGLQQRTIGPDLGMAIHAGFRRRNSGKGTFLDRRVAIPTVYSIVADVMLMAKRDRLDARNADLGNVR